VKFPCGKLKRRWESSLEVFLSTYAYTIRIVQRTLFAAGGTRVARRQSLPRTNPRIAVSGGPAIILSDAGEAGPSASPYRHSGNLQNVTKEKEPINPFHGLVAALGILFVITACAYATMLYRSIHLAAQAEGLMALLDRHGMSLLAAELTALGAATFAAIWLDRFRAVAQDQQRRDAAESGQESQNETNTGAKNS
jgi:hypothetical protein